VRKQGNIFNHIDWFLILAYLVFSSIGLVNITAALYNEETFSFFDFSQNYTKQAVLIGIGLLMGMVILSLDARFYEYFAYPIYLISLLSLVLVLIFGAKISGARSWFQIGSFSLQPAEFAKAACALAVAKYLSGRQINLEKWKPRLFAAILVSLPVVLILPQPDLGSAVVFSSFIFVFYREGLSPYYIFSALFAGLLFILALLIDPNLLLIVFAGVAAVVVLLLFRSKQGIIIGLLAILVAGLFIHSVDFAFNNLLEDRHRNRINIMLGKENDPTGVGYNTHQSLIAIGSGGFTGKGLFQGTQTKFNFVPEQHTDFIFCTIGEEWGFLGSTLFIVLYLVFLARIIWVAERQKSAFSRVYGYAVASVFFIHFVLNIAMTIGLFPVIGIPLPFISYGGSSLWGFTVLLFIFIKLDANRMEIL